MPKSGKNLSLLTASRLVSILGSNVFSFALSLYVLDLTGSAAIFSAVLALSIIPGVLVNLFGGVLIDRYNKKKIIVVSDALSGMLMLGLLFCLGLNPTNIATIIIFDILLSIVQSYNGLAIMASIPDMVSEKQLARANSTMQVIPTLIAIIGPVIGAIVYKLVGIEQVIMINAGSYLMAAFFVLLIRLYRQNLSIAGDQKTNYWLDLKEAFQYLHQHRLLRFLMFIAVLINAIYIPMVLLVMPFINYQVIKISGLQLSFIEAAWGIGGTLGGIYISLKKDTNPMIRKLFVLLIAQAVLMVLWSFPVLPALSGTDKNMITAIFCILLITTGLLNMVQNIPVLTYFQQQIPEHLRAKILGFINAACMLAIPAGMWLFGFLLEHVTWYYITSASGIIMALVCYLSGRNKHFVAFSNTLQHQHTEIHPLPPPAGDMPHLQP